MNEPFLVYGTIPFAFTTRQSASSPLPDAVLIVGTIR